MKKQLSDWVKQHSAKDYKECYRVLNYPGYTDEEDYKLIFYISEVKIPHTQGYVACNTSRS